jgi:hypothetical protein
MNRNRKLFFAALLVGRLLLTAVDADEATPAPEKAPPLPLHTIDGVGGVVITPIAYLVNPGPEKQLFGLPSISATFVGAGQKNVESFVLTETLWRRVELGFAASRFGLGNFPTAVQQATGVNIDRSDVWLYSFNARALVLPEGSFNLPLPAVTLGTQVKLNDGIKNIDNSLGGAVTWAGLRDDVGEDFVLTASKLFPKLGFGRPVIVSGGARVSDAAWGGYVGFGRTYHVTAEGNVVWLLFDRLGLAFEYRQYPNPYRTITVGSAQLLRPENDWFTIGAAYVLNNHTTFTAGYGHFGGLLNTIENAGWAVSAKYEF